MSLLRYRAVQDLRRGDLIRVDRGSLVSKHDTSIVDDGLIGVAGRNIKCGEQITYIPDKNTEDVLTKGGPIRYGQ